MNSSSPPRRKMTSPKALRVVIVDDSSTARMLLRSLLKKDPDITVVGEAANGAEAISLVREQRPDLVTMDIHMPVMDGIAAIDAIMHDKAVPILVVTSESAAELAIKALDAGALEVMAKPDSSAQSASDFIHKVRILAGVSVFTRFRQWSGGLPPHPAPTAQALSQSLPAAAPTPSEPVFAIACSTGGPQALGQILPGLGADFAAPILIAQHMSDGFVEGMAHWLNKLCYLRVKVAEDGEPLNAGVVYISPSEANLVVAGHNRLALLPRRDSDIYHPSCDLLLTSVAETYGHRGVGIILTGMGRDGAQGLRHLHDKGGICLAQDEATSLIYGMNHEAVKSGCVHQELPLLDIAATMRRLLHSSEGSTPHRQLL